MLLSQALLPITASQGVSVCESSSDGAGGARMLQWSSQHGAAPEEDTSVEGALLAVLRFVAGKQRSSLECSDPCLNFLLYVKKLLET